MNTYEMKTNDTEVTIYRIGENGQEKVKEKIAKIDLKTGELVPIGRTRIAGAKPTKVTAPESKFPTKTVIPGLIILAFVIGIFAFSSVTHSETGALADLLYYLLGFTSLTSVVISIVLYIKWLIKKAAPNVSEESDTLDELSPSLPQNVSSEPAADHGEVEEDIQRTIITSENDSYFLLLGGAVKGPFTYDQIKKSEFPNNVLVTTENLTDWFPAGNLELLRGIAFEPKDPSMNVGEGDYQITAEGFIKCLNK